MNPEDGFVYPPTVETVRFPPDRPDLREIVEGTRRTTLLWRLPASHVIRLPSRKVRDVEREDAWFIINLLAYLFGVRLKLDPWWFDGRVAVRLQRTHNIHFSREAAQDFISRSYATWRCWPKRDRTLFATLLHSHCRAPSYEWDWERFGAEYTVLDSLALVAERPKLIVAPTKTTTTGTPPKKGKKKRRRVAHGERLRTLAKAMGVKRPPARVRRIVKLRNALLHEGLWDGQLPGSGTSRAMQLADDLRRINHRLIPALLGYRNQYVRTAWWTIGTRGFDPP